MDGLTESSLVGDTKPKPKPKSQLDERVQQLIELICNVQAMEDTVVEMKYDAKKAPLGTIYFTDAFYFILFILFGRQTD